MGRLHPAGAGQRGRIFEIDTVGNENTVAKMKNLRYNIATLTKQCLREWDATPEKYALETAEGKDLVGLGAYRDMPKGRKKTAAELLMERIAGGGPPRPGNLKPME